MKKLLTEIKSILTGTRHLDESWNLSSACFASALIHLTFLIVFAKNALWLLVVYNAFIVIAYIANGIYVKKTDKYKKMYYFTIIEVSLHSALASLLAGWNCGFMLYTISMVSVSFYFMMVIRDYNRHLRYPLISTFFILSFFLFTRYFCVRITPYYADLVTTKLATWLYCFNTVLAFTICFVFSLFFTLEVFYTQNQLISENTMLDQMASHDPLTKLLNRRSMEPHLERAMEHAKKTSTPFTVVMGDIDDFKKVNDTYGHDYGDKILVMISEIIRTQIRNEDKLCRWGGEEFLVLLRTDEPAAVKTMERIRLAISEATLPIDTDPAKKLSVTMTFGVSTYIPGCSMEKLIQLADDNLYRGKKNGKNQVVV